MELAILFLLVGGFLVMGLWIGLSLLGAGLVALFLFKDVNTLSTLAFSAWTGLTAAELAPLPLFVLMGELLVRSRIAKDLFHALGPMAQRLPGGLVQTNIIGCTLMAAACGSSAATTATIGRITLGELKARGYGDRVAMGSLCGAGTLGFLIPPSIVLILYGVLAEVSILDLFVAGIMPGLILAGLFMVYTGVRVGRTNMPHLTAQPGSFLRILPLMGLITAVLGSLYGGFATPVEAAIIGVSGALVIVWRQADTPWQSIAEAIAGAVRTSAMIGLILLGALFFSRVSVYLGLPEQVDQAAQLLGNNPVMLIAFLILIYAFLGMILDGLSLIVMTLPIAGPLAAAAGFDPLWFGIFLVILVEMGQITPPLGFNLFVVQSLTGAPLNSIARAALPYFLIMLGFALLLAAIPDLALWLPAQA